MELCQHVCLFHKKKYKIVFSFRCSASVVALLFPSVASLYLCFVPAAHRLRSHTARPNRDWNMRGNRAELDFRGIVKNGWNRTMRGDIASHIRIYSAAVCLCRSSFPWIYASRTRIRQTNSNSTMYKYLCTAGRRRSVRACSSSQQRRNKQWTQSLLAKLGAPNLSMPMSTTTTTDDSII